MARIWQGMGRVALQGIRLASNARGLSLAGALPAARAGMRQNALVLPGGSRMGTTGRFMCSEAGGGGGGGGQPKKSSHWTETSRMPGQKRSPVSWASVGLLSLCGGGLVWYVTNEQNERVRKREAPVKKEKGLGRPDIGGPFNLIDVSGKPRTDKDFLGKWMFIYFGFTYCPDVCPNELMRMAQIIESVEKNPATKGKMQPLFITIDPERDGPQQLKEYLSDWHPKMIGLTGKPDQVAKAVKSYRVYASKSQVGDKPGDYLIDHSIMFYLMNDKGEYVDYFGKALTAEDITEKITSYMTGRADDDTHSDSSIASKEIVAVK